MKRKILLVEDEALIAIAEVKTIEKYSFDVVTAYSGEKAIEIVRQDPEISLILMDIDLGKGMDGTEAAQEILKTHDLPVAFLSSHTEPEVVEKTEGITSYGFIVKNSGETVLMASIRMAFRLFDAHMELKLQKEHLRNTLVRQEQTEEELVQKSEELESYFHSSLDLLCIAGIEGKFLRLNPEWRAKVNGNTVYAVARDITGRKEVEDNLRITLDSIGDAVISTDIQGNVVRMNPVAERLSGWNLEEAEGKKLEEVFSIVNAHTQEKVDNPVQDVLHNGKIVGLANHTVLLSRDGSRYQIADSAAPIQDESGVMHGVVLVFRDVTEQYRMHMALQESEEKYRALFDQSVLGVYIHDLAGAIIEVNEVACKQSGYSREELLGSNVFSLHSHEEDSANLPVQDILQMWRQMEPGKRFVTEADHIRKDGSAFPVRVSTGPIHYGGGRVIMAIVEGISHRE